MYKKITKNDKITRKITDVHSADNYLTKETTKNISLAINRLNGNLDLVKTVNERVFYFIIIVISTAILYLILKNTNDPLPFLDALTTTTSYVATFYMVTKKTDTWILWFINDILYVIEYWLLPNQAIYLMLLNIIWTGMAIGSFITWNKIYENQLEVNDKYA